MLNYTTCVCIKQNMIFIFWETWPNAHQIKHIFVFLKWKLFSEIVESFEILMKKRVF
jgi:hypothetical protein